MRVDNLLELLAPALNVDWIKVDSFEPHWLPDLKVKNRNAPDQEFFCPKVTWSRNGKIFCVRVPILLCKHRYPIPFFDEATWHSLNYKAMQDWVIETILRENGEIGKRTKLKIWNN